jgi:hypothetical protein
MSGPGSKRYGISPSVYTRGKDVSGPTWLGNSAEDSDCVPVGEDRSGSFDRSRPSRPISYVSFAPFASEPAWRAICSDGPTTNSCDATNSSYSITSSARARSSAGMVSPSVFAVFWLMTNSYLVGLSTASSAGLAPCSILST